MDTSDSRFQIKFHKVGWRFWIANAILVTLCFAFLPALWQEISVLYLVYVSLYANFASDYTGQSAAEGSLQTESEDGPRRTKQ